MCRIAVAWVISKLRWLSSVNELEQAQAAIIKLGLSSQNDVTRKLMDFAALSPSGSLAHAQSIFEETTMDDPSGCNTILRAYSQSAFPIKALHVYNHMQRKKVACDRSTYNFAIKACSRVIQQVELNEFEIRIDYKESEIHCMVLKSGYESDQHIRNSLVCYYANRGLLDLARQMFDEMSNRSVASWNIIISAYDKANEFNTADYLFELMPTKNIVSWNTLIKRYVRLGDMKSARSVFDSIPKRDSASWNSIIAGYIQIKDYEKAFTMYHEMQLARFEPTEITLTSILGACAETGALAMGRNVHDYLKIKGRKVEGYLGIALLDMYAKCGILNSAWEVFNSLKMKPVGCWNAMIVSLAVHGYSLEALELFSSMEKRLHEVMPNRITFIGVLIACCRKGLLAEGREYFYRLMNVYKITPDIKHYGCMVDLYCRCGLLEDAYQMVRTVPWGKNSVLWRTLLAACKMHGNVVLAEECFQQLAKLEPVTDGSYVLLSNVYAQAGKWGGVESARTDMMRRRIWKTPGASLIQRKFPKDVGNEAS